MRIGIGALLCCSVGCASSTPAGTVEAPKEIERTERPVDLSGEWNDTDADLVASGIIGDCLGAEWIARWSDGHDGSKPVVRLYPIRNRTTAYIDHRYFTKQIEAALVNSGRVEVVRSLEELENDDGEVAGPAPSEPGADFILNGTIVSQEDQAGNKEVRAYLTSIELVEVESNKKAWVGQKRIRKLITR